MADYNLGTARGKIVIDADGAVAGMSKASGAAGGAKKSLESSASSFMGAGKTIALAGGAIVGVFGYAIKTASDFEKRISAIGAVSGATGPQLDEIRKKALKLGADTSFSASEAASAMEELVKAGLTVPDVMNGAADATVALAAAGEIDLPQAASIAANAMNQFGLSAQEMPKIADLIAGAANASSIDVSDFGMSMSQVGAVANLAGLSFEDTAVAITAMGNAGIKGSDAGTSLKSMLAHLQPQSKKAAGAMKELGVITEDGTNLFYDQHGKIKSLAEISEVLAKGTKGMTAEQKSANLQIAFGTDGIRAAAIVSKEGAAGINDLSTQLGKISAADVAAKRMDNLSGSVEQFKGSMETVLINVGEIFQPILKNIVQFATGLVNAFSGIDPKVLRFIVIIGGVVGTLLVAFGSFLVVAGGVMKLAATFQALTTALAANPIVLIIGALILLAVAIGIAYVKFKGFRDVVNAIASGIFDLFKPLIDIVIPFLKNMVKQIGNLFSMFRSGQGDSQGFAEIMDNIFGNTGKLIPIFRSLYDTVVTVFNWIKDNVVPVVSRFIERIGGMKTVLKLVGVAFAFLLAPAISVVAALVYAYKHFETFRNIVQAVARVIAGVLMATFRWLQDNLPKVGRIVVNIAHFFAFLGKEIAERLKSAFDWLKKNVFPVISAFAELVGAVVGLIVKTWKKLWPAFEFVGKLLGAVLLPIFLLVFNLIKAAISVFVGIAVRIWQTFADKIFFAIKIAWDLIRSVISGALSVIKGIMQVVTGLIKGDWGKVWDGIKSILSGVWNAIKGIVTAAINTVKNTISIALGVISVVWHAIWDSIKAVFKAIWNTMQTITSGAIGKIVDFVKAIPGRVLGAIGSLARTLYGAGKDLIGGLLSGAKRIFLDVVDFLKSLPGRIINGLGNIGRILYDVGKKIMGGLKDGLVAGLDAVKGALGGVAGKIVSWKGPPEYDKTILIGNGKLIMQGLISGIESMSPNLKSTLAGITAGIPSAAAPSAPSAATGITLQLNFNGTFGAGSEQAIRETVTDKSVLREVINAARAGVGR